VIILTAEALHERKHTAYWARLCATLSVFLIGISCSSGNAPPATGTPPFYWSAARETFAAGDYQKTLDHLENLINTQNDYTARALPWYLVMTSGMARAYNDLADSFEAGGRANKTDPSAFRRHLNQTRTMAGRSAVHFAEAFAQFQKDKTDPVPLAFRYPTGGAAPVPALLKVANGMLPPASEIEIAQKRALERGVLFQTCYAVGAPDDLAKTQELFKAADVQTSRAVFVTAMASALYDGSQLFSRTKLDDPDKMRIFCTRAQEALKTLPESKQVKDLNL
jgi:hypothetical protein